MNCLRSTYIFNIGVRNKIMKNLKYMTFCQVSCSSAGYMTALNQNPLIESSTLSYTVCWNNAVMRKYYCLQKLSLDWTPVTIHWIVRKNTSRHLTCIALFPSLTTSNKVTGSPSPFCCGCPLALPRLAPRAPASERPLSAGDFRGFLVADWAKKTSRVRVYYTYIWNNSVFLYKPSINITWLHFHTFIHTKIMGWTRLEGTSRDLQPDLLLKVGSARKINQVAQDSIQADT